jgi:hypothetical protein
MPAGERALAVLATERSACLDSATGSVSLKRLGQAAGLGLTIGLVGGVVEGVKARRTYIGVKVSLRADDLPRQAVSKSGH